MIAYLPTRIFTASTEPQYMVIEPHNPNPVIECIQKPNSKCRQGQSDNGDLGGHFAVMATVSGTASEVTQNMTQFIPWNYPNPSNLIKLNFEAHNLEIKPEIRLTQKTDKPTKPLEIK